MSFVGGIYKKTKNLSRMFTWVGVVCMIFMACMILTSVVFRYILSKGFQSSTEAVGIAFLISIFSGIGYCWFEKGHVRILLFVNMFSPRWQNYMERIAAASGALLYSLLTYKAFAYISYTLRVDKRFEETEWPWYPFIIFMAVASLFFVFQLFLSAVVPKKYIDEAES